MISYDRINMGGCCPGHCAFCREREGTYRELPELMADIAQARRPLNLCFNSGHAAGSPALVPLLRWILLDGPRRLKVKVSGAGKFDETLLARLLTHRVLLYEIEYLGPNARIHDKITGIRGSFREVERAMDRLLPGVRKTATGRTPFVSVVIPVCGQNIGSLTRMVSRVIKRRPDRIIFLNTGAIEVSRLVLELRSVLSVIVKASIWPVLSGFPFCAIPGLEHFSQELYDRQVLHPKAPFCEDCIFAETCCRVSPDYVEDHGPAEFGSIAWHPRQADLLQLLNNPGVPPVSTRAAPQSGEEA